MSLEYAILGFLHYEPLSGYDLKKIINLSVNHFWSADQSQIYRTLSNLTKKSLVHPELIFNDNKPNSKIYHITEEGKARFAEWLETPTFQTEIKLPWLIQLFFANGLSDEKIVALLETFLSQLQEKSNTHTNSAKQFDSKGMLSSRDCFFKDLTIDYGLMINHSTQNWFKKTIARIKNKEYEIATNA